MATAIDRAKRISRYFMHAPRVPDPRAARAWRCWCRLQYRVGEAAQVILDREAALGLRPDDDADDD